MKAALGLLVALALVSCKTGERKEEQGVAGAPAPLAAVPQATQAKEPTLKLITLDLNGSIDFEAAHNAVSQHFAAPLPPSCRAAAQGWGPGQTATLRLKIDVDTRPETQHPLKMDVASTTPQSEPLNACVRDLVSQPLTLYGHGTGSIVLAISN